VNRALEVILAKGSKEKCYKESLGLLKQWDSEGYSDEGSDENKKEGMRYLIYCKNFCKCHNAPLPNTTTKK
jgi:hypothetical protein